MALKTTLDDIKDRLDALLTYANGVTGESDTSIGDAIETLADGYGQGGSSLPIQLDLLGTWTFEKEEWTNTSTADTMSTGFSSTGDTEHIYYICTVECDGTLDTSNVNNWGGLTIMFGGKYQKGRSSGGGRYFHVGNVQFRGVNKPMTYDDTEGSADPVSSVAYGVYLGNTSASLTVNRKAHSTNCPKIMGGTYTINLYGISAV